MAATPEQVRDALTKYIEAWSTGNKELLLSVFAADASFCDPVGTPEFVGHDGIGRFWDFAHQGEARKMIPKLEEIRACGSEGILRFTMQVRIPEKNKGLDLTIIEYASVDDDGKIKTLRAFWGPENGSCPPGMEIFIPDVGDAYE
jgi:steroid delta-isomerase